MTLYVIEHGTTVRAMYRTSVCLLAFFVQMFGIHNVRTELFMNRGRMCTHSECMWFDYASSALQDASVNKRYSLMSMFKIERCFTIIIRNYNCVFNSRATKILLSFITKINYEE